MKKIKYKFTDMALPKSGYHYLVSFYDFGLQKKQIAAAMWKRSNNKQNGYFDYCMKGRFVDQHSPQIGKKSMKYRVDGWANVMNDWEEE